MSEIPSFDELKALLPKRDQDAAAHIYTALSERLLGVVRSQLGLEFQAKLDPEDVVQSAFRSLFRRLRDGEYPNLGSWVELWRLLVAIALHKCSNRRDYYRAQCRNVNQEVSLEALSHSPGGGYEVIDKDPSPEQVAIAADLVAYVIRKCGDWNRPILQLYFQDYTVREISEKLGCSKRMVKRALERAWDVATRLFQEEKERDGQGA